MRFLVLEMFFWDHPVGRRIFAMTPEVSASSAVLAKNQGLLFTQALPALVALVCVLAAPRDRKA